MFTWSQKHVFYIGWGSERGKSPVSAWDGCYFLSEQGENSNHCGVGSAQWPCFTLTTWSRPVSRQPPLPGQGCPWIWDSCAFGPWACLLRAVTSEPCICIGTVGALWCIPPSMGRGVCSFGTGTGGEGKLGELCYNNTNTDCILYCINKSTAALSCWALMVSMLWTFLFIFLW